MTEGKHDENEINCNCPICKDILIIPRLYECGHSACEKCMIGYDNVQDGDNNRTFDLTEYNCPLCRHKTIKTWSNRPINHQLISVLEKNPKYNQLVKKYREECPEPKPYIVPKGLNLSYIAHKSRLTKAHELYNELLPLLYDAAINGIPRITITTNIKKYRYVSDILSKLLFGLGIKRYYTTPTEVNIDIIALPIRSWRFEYTNPNYNVSDEWLDDETEQVDYQTPPPDIPPPTPPPPPPPGITPLFRSRRYMQEFHNLSEITHNRRDSILTIRDNSTNNS